MLAAGVKGWDSETLPESGYKYVRRVNGLWQARVFAGPHSGSPRLNLGLHPTAREAWRAVCRWARTGRRPSGVLPTYVRPARGGGFVGRVARNGRRIEVGPLPTAEEVAVKLEQKLADLPVRPRRYRPPLTPGEEAVLAAVRALAAGAGGGPLVRVTVTTRTADPDKLRTVVVRPPG